jgi:hypothetical protein
MSIVDNFELHETGRRKIDDIDYRSLVTMEDLTERNENFLNSVNLNYTHEYRFDLNLGIKFYTNPDNLKYQLKEAKYNLTNIIYGDIIKQTHELRNLILSGDKMKALEVTDNILNLCLPTKGEE